jgi:hypothetical protein
MLRGRISREIRVGHPGFPTVFPAGKCPVSIRRARLDLGPGRHRRRRARPRHGYRGRRRREPQGGLRRHALGQRGGKPPLNASPAPGRVHRRDRRSSPARGCVRVAPEAPLLAQRHDAGLRNAPRRGRPASAALVGSVTSMPLSADASVSFGRDVVAERQHLVGDVRGRGRVQDRHRASRPRDGQRPFRAPSRGCSSCVTKTFACAISVARASTSAGEIVPADAGADDDRVVARCVVEKMKADPVGCSAGLQGERRHTRLGPDLQRHVGEGVLPELRQEADIRAPPAPPPPPGSTPCRRDRA